MKIDPANLDLHSFAEFIKTMTPRAGMHPIEEFPPASRVRMLRQVKAFADSQKDSNGRDWAIPLPKFLTDALAEAEQLVAEGRGHEGGDDLQESVGDG